ncbi:MAG: 23S rRNA pseudouridine2605 synthase [Myxococcota bacterium]|jgi:23S rRNA pseudouridine2605 synthase
MTRKKRAPQGQKTRSPQDRMKRALQGRKKAAAQGQKKQGAQGQKKQGAQGQKKQGAQGQKKQGVQGQKKQGAQGQKRMLPRLLSRWNVASRKKAEQLVHDGRVSVDGRVERNVLALVGERASITVNGKPVGPARELAWLALNKPRGVITTTDDPEGRRTVLDLVKSDLRGLSPVGRLDLASGGLLLLTNDHALAATLLDPTTHVTKTYRLKVRGQVADAVIARLGRETIEVDGLVLGPIQARVSERTPKSTWLEITLAEGKNRQLRRQLDYHGHEVQVLVRTAFGPIALGDLAAGAHRRLTPAEVACLRTAAR